jgi:chorismate mutase
LSVTLDPGMVDDAWPRHRLEALTCLIVDRLLLADDVAAAKFLTGAPIDDPAREQQVLARIQRQAGTGPAPDTATTFLRDQFAASKVVQRGLFSRWTAHPEEAPTARPDLGRVRERLDLLTTRLLRELKGPDPPRDEVERFRPPRDRTDPGRRTVRASPVLPTQLDDHPAPG